MLQEFKKFILRGNVMDMAVGIIIGAAFTTVVKSLVSDIIMPPIGKITGGVDFSDLFINLSDTAYASVEAAEEAGAAIIKYGVFLNNVISLLLVGFAVFMLIKMVNNLQAKEEAKPATPPKQEVLLEEIRDLLKKQ